MSKYTDLRNRLIDQFYEELNNDVQALLSLYPNVKSISLFKEDNYYNDEDYSLRISPEAGNIVYEDELGEHELYNEEVDDSLPFCQLVDDFIELINSIPSELISMSFEDEYTIFTKE